MATLAGGGQPQSFSLRNYRADQGFFTGLSTALSLLILLGFAQLALRGLSDPVGAPARVHVHALLLIGWLAVFSAQNWLAWRGNLAFHRKLGWAALGLVTAVVVANGYVTIKTIVEDRLPPDNTPPFFVGLGTADTLCFAGLVAWAVAWRRDTQWHRRLVFGATLVLSAAAFNRLLIPIAGAEQFFLSLACQMALVLLLAWHDRNVLGQVHRATLVIAGTILLQRTLPFVLQEFPPLAAYANGLAG